MGTGTPVSDKEIITADKMNLKIESVAENVLDVKASRTKNTTYQNTNPNRTLLCIISVETTNVNTGSAQMYGLVENVSPPTVKKSSSSTRTNCIESVYFMGTLTFLVPPNHYYQLQEVKIGTASSSISAWTETLL